jgi:hypothetical protein
MAFSIYYVPYVFLSSFFLAALASWLRRQHRFWLFLADKLGKKFGQQFFFSGPRYVVNPYCLLSDKLKTNIQYIAMWSKDMTITFVLNRKQKLWQLFILKTKAIFSSLYFT